MVQPPTLPVSSGEDGKPAVEQQIPITDINLTSLRQMREAAAQAKKTDSSALFGEPGPYRIGPGDVLQITVWDHPELAAAVGPPGNPQRPSDAAGGFVVDHDGNVQLPYAGKVDISGDAAGLVHVGGETADQAQRKIYRLLSEVFVKPQVTVRVTSFRAGQIYVDGEVRAPGAQTINDIPMTLSEALNRAGGFSPNADQSRIVIVRDGTSYPVNVTQMIESGQSPSRVMLKNGDMLRVMSREDNGVYVMGEVGKPATVMPMTDGKLTLAEALSQAGSVNPGSADAKELYVIRDAARGKPEIYHLNATSPVSMLLANQFNLQSKDVVYIDSSGLVRFSRVLNLLLPLVNAGLTTAIVTK
ncbi:polysaccharide biosynthesis/export family protein [Paraburkholderia sp. BL10I2N1]|uniref:polysaccharide biosynthesis/export family protein n=1 Tax=Paraburkholderia sp. BL10I2N1 TaxID=1938796 RepID=UPI001FB5E674|nr:polysaccharide biosynthesis/export family protein [Paraburkholderia sp. BL10I2N1]